MGIKRGPNVVTDGLVLAVDAANPTSYPGSGTTCNDLTITQNNGTLINGTSFDTSNKGVFDLDGVNDRITFNNLNIGINDISIQMWVKTTKSSFNYPMAQGGGANSSGERGVGIGLTGDGYVYGFINSSNTRIMVNTNPIKSVNDGNWHNIAGVWDRSDKLTWYVDGVFDQEGDISSTDGQSITLEKDLYIGNYGTAPNTTGAFNGSIGPAYVYMRTLSVNEIFQNYNALKSRFGL